MANLRPIAANSEPPTVPEAHTFRAVQSLPPIEIPYSRECERLHSSRCIESARSAYLLPRAYQQRASDTALRLLVRDQPDHPSAAEWYGSLAQSHGDPADLLVLLAEIHVLNGGDGYLGDGTLLHSENQRVVLDREISEGVLGNALEAQDGPSCTGGWATREFAACS